MKFTSYSVLFQDSYTKRFKTVQTGFLSSLKALDWINLDNQWKKDYELGKIKIIPKKEDTKNYVESQQKELIKMIKEFQA
uniref:ORF24 n=1 Tax=Nitrosopumilaceae spindle-shaped virus TaxID=3065433 RepID=A0AAT9JAD9_9VIRU